MKILLTIVLLGAPVLASEVGMTEVQLIAEKGVPDQRMETKDGALDQYHQCQAPIQGLLWVLLIPRCHRTIYTIEKGIVTHISRVRERR